MIYWVNAFAVSPNDSGGTRHYEMARFLGQHGEAVSILASDFHLTKRTYTRRSSQAARSVIAEQIDGVEFRWVYASPYSQNDWRRMFNMVSFAWYVFMYLVKVPINAKTVFIGSSPHLLGALATCMVAQIRRVPFVFEVRDLWPESLVDMTKRYGLSARIMRLMANYLYRFSNQIIVLAQHSQDHIAKLGFDRKKIVYIPNGVDFQNLSSKTEGSPVPLPKDKTLFVYAGAHGPANHLEVVVEAAQVLQSRGDDQVHILLIGDGPTKAALTQRVKELGLQNIVFHDPISKNEMPRLLASVDVGLLTLFDAPVFRFGVSPNKLFDYMAAGLPVLTNVQGDVASIVQTAQCGIVVGPSDPVALADGMVQMCNQLKTDPEFGVGGTQYVLEHHNRGKLVEQLKAVIQKARGDNHEEPIHQTMG